MCTVTVIPSEDGYTLTMNRDELRHREEAGLKVHTQGTVKFCHPVDAEAGGTWVGANNHGVVLALLNRYQAPTIATARTRGEIIANALPLGHIDSILTYFQQLDTHFYNPFDCLVISQKQMTLFSWDRTCYKENSIKQNHPLMFTSSSERLKEVSSYRQHLFNHWQQLSGRAADADLFHLQQAEGQAASAVLMSRELAHSKSLVQITMQGGHCQIDYYDLLRLKANTRLDNLLPKQGIKMDLIEKLSKAI